MATTFNTTATNVFTGKEFEKKFAASLNALPAEAEGVKEIQINGRFVKSIKASDHWAHFNPGTPAAEVVSDRKLAAAMFNISTDDKLGEIFGDYGFMVDYSLTRLHGHCQRVGVVEAGYYGKYYDLFANAVPGAEYDMEVSDDPLRSALQNKDAQKLYSVSYDEDPRTNKGFFVVGPELVYTPWEGDARLIPAEIAGVNGRIMRFNAFQKIATGNCIMVIWNDRFDNYVNVKANQFSMENEELVQDKRQRVAKKVINGRAAVGYAKVAEAQSAAVEVVDGVEIQHPIELALATRNIKILADGKVSVHDIDELGMCTLYRTAYGTILPGKCPLGDDAASRFMISSQAAAGTIFALQAPNS